MERLLLAGGLPVPLGILAERAMMRIGAEETENARILRGATRFGIIVFVDKGWEVGSGPN